MIFTFFFILNGCANRFDHFRLEHGEVLMEQVVVKDYSHRESKFFVDMLRVNGTLKKKDFLILREIVSATLENQGHKRVYTKKEADLIVLIDQKVTGPYVLKRTGINKVWTNYKPEFNFTFNIEGVELEAAYEYLKKVRDISEWKMHKEKFIFKHLVYISQLDIRAFDLEENRSSNDVESEKIAWYAKIKSLGNSARKDDHLYRMMTAFQEKMGKEAITREQLSIFDDDTDMAHLKSLVFAEDAYQGQRTKQPLLEEFRHLSDEEFENYYTNRERPFDITPLYRN